MIALGAKAHATDRGKSLSHLIQYGKSYCHIKVTLSNSGIDPYRSDVFGKSITVERRILRAGGGAYIIRGEFGKVSDRKSDLNSILDHFNIHVDNTLTWLTQDAAKEFLMNVKESDLYHFFAKGADIVQTEETYSDIALKLVQCSDRISKIRESLMDLKQRRTLQRSTCNELKQAAQAAQQHEDSVLEIEWSQIADLEKRYLEIQQAAEQEDQKVTDAQQKMKEKQEEVALILQEMEETEREADATPNVANDIEGLQTKLKERKLEIRSVSGEIRHLQSDLKQLDSNVETIQIELRKVEHLLSLPAQQQRASKEGELKEMEINVLHLKQKQDDLQQTLNREKSRMNGLQPEMHQLMSRKQDLESSVMEQERRIKDLESLRVNRVNLWGNNMARIIQTIEETQWEGIRPIGPFGLYVQPKPSCRHWLPVLRILIGKSMADFIVETHHDRKKLSDILKNFKQFRSNVLVVRNPNQAIDLRNELPPSIYLNVLSTLDINHVAVKKALVTNSRIEQLILFESRNAAEQEVKQFKGAPPNVRGMYLPDGYQLGLRGGSRSMIAPQRWNRPCPFGEEDVGDQISKCNEAIQQGRSGLSKVVEDTRRVRLELQNGQQVIQTTSQELRQIEKNLSQLSNRIRYRKDELAEEAPVEISSFEAALRQSEEERQVLRSQISGLEETLLRLQNEHQSIEVAKREIEQRSLSSAQMKKQIAARLRELNASKQRIEQHVSHYESKGLEYARNAMQHRQNALEQLDAVNRAIKEMPVPRPAQIRTKRELELEMHRLQSIVDETRKKYGSLTMEQAVLDYQLAKDAYDGAKHESLVLQELMHELRKSLSDRSQALNRIVNYISEVACISFRRRMAKRNFHAELIFDHQEKKLQVHAQMEGSGADRSMRTYSGGEKSFTTVCLLLALWDAIPSPIRCLDEFDVYMDEVNRVIAMKELIDAAVKSEQQYVFITPLRLECVPFVHPAVILAVYQNVCRANLVSIHNVPVQLQENTMWH
jgi:chromosome segregation ATPase